MAALGAQVLVSPFACGSLRRELVPGDFVVVDQLVGEQNAAAVARYLATGDVDHRFPLEPTGPAQDLSVPGAVRQLGSVATLVEGDTALWAGVDIPAGEQHRPSGASTVALLGMVAVAAAAAGLPVVATGAPLMKIVPVQRAYVEANFKEGQLRKVRVGQPVTLTSDLYGSGVKFHGRVVGFSGGTGSAGLAMGAGSPAAGSRPK